ncbi:UPAR/Ly6 domain-containing protein bou-like isoform X1 [Lepeophtheirus salmonis]|uniref:UPAR/Ly6 domain-containing protein bou-like isoform X1 n=1 Tax=Lepeophtheirus salmonis TaxID=72036 RepID=UPI001AE2534B|nr:uncharacterized protein LOC121128746 isoform X1 [Lepeophtheirus salmonis]
MKWIFLYCLTINFFKMGMSSIDCYTCSSMNNTDPHCEDPMSPAYKKLKENCKVPKVNHIGTFPANFCVKMIGTSLKSGESLVIRTCVFEDMNSQCGTFHFQNDTLSGCILTCNYDGCNGGHRTLYVQLLLLLPLGLVFKPLI